MADAETKEELKKLKEEKKAFKNDQKKAKAEDRARRKEAKKRARSATSPACPMRLIGMAFFHVSSGREFVISVSINPGAIALQHMPREPSSFAMVFVSAISPALAAV